MSAQAPLASSADSSDRVSPVEFQVLNPLEIDLVFEFASQRLHDENLDEVTRTFRSWQAKWRRESLEHYLKLGWSFGAYQEHRLVGFFLAQPFLFFRGQTQSLWVEAVEAARPEVFEALIDVAVRIGREKHLQRVLFADAQILEQASGQAISRRQSATGLASSLKLLEDDIAVVQTTKG